jgi:hypothetical protein
MNRKLLSLSCLLLGLTQFAFPQGGTTGYPFDVPTDPRSVAMGESFVAVPSNPGALMVNPAGLAGLSGVNVSYSRKSIDWYLQGWSFASVNAAAATPFGVFAAQYNRKLMGTLPVATMQFPDGDGTEMTLYSYDIALGYAHRFPGGFAVGISAKRYDFRETVTGPSSGAIPTWTGTPAYLFDIGFTYTLPRLHSQATVEDSISLGMAYQNIGETWKAEYHLPPGWLSANQPFQEFQLNEYFRAGLSYALRLRPSDPGAVSPFVAVISGEFRSLQGPVSSGVGSAPAYIPLGGGLSYHGTSYWGVGLECTVFEFVSVRGGATFKPYTDVEAERDRPSFRYGGGIRLPLQRIGIDIPLTASFQYAVITVSEPLFIWETVVNKGTFPVFSLEIQYTGCPW